MRYEEILENLQKALEELKEENAATPVIVEGEKDARSLRNLGLEGEIITVNKGSSLFNFCERVSTKHKLVVVLTDWDSRGGTLCRRIQEGLAANGAKSNLEYRQRIAVLCRKDVKDVEGLPNYLRTLERWTKEQRRVGARLRTDESLRRARAAKERRH
jgi:5S rRNA maturation endonuclease (ribonuclease M5)